VRRPLGVSTLAVVFVACIFLANYFVTHVGRSTASGAHVIPVGFGLETTSGVVFIGLSLALRDALQEATRAVSVVALILVGGVASALVNWHVGFASAVSYVASEFLDFAVYTPLRERSVISASIVSNTLGALVDSLIFLALAFGWSVALELAPGNVIGKVEWGIVGIPIVIWARRRRQLAT